MITLQMGIWLAVVAFVSVAILLGIYALTNRINAIDERLADLRRLETRLSRGCDDALTNQASQLSAISLHLDQLKRQQAELLLRVCELADSVDVARK